MAKINFEDIKGNSYTDRNKDSPKSVPEKTKRPDIKPAITKDRLVRDKKTFGQKLKGMFIQDDLADIKKWVIEDVIAPGIKGLILDTISMAFFHETYTRGRGIFNRTSGGNVPYHTMSYKPSGGSTNSSSSSRQNNNRYIDDDRDRIDYRNVVLTYKDDAEKVVKLMYEAIEEYGRVSIGDLYQIIDLSPKANDFNWGWTDQRDIGIKRVSDGFLIDVADARFIE